MEKHILVVYVFFSITYIHSQTGINVESLREVTDEKWIGSIGLNMGLIKNTNNIFWVSNNAQIQHKDSTNTNFWLLYNHLNFQKLEGKSFVNKGIQHLRYNRKITNKTKMEAFVQTQYDVISKIDLRLLIGAGPRFKLSNNDNCYRIYLGTLVMYEHEKKQIFQKK